VFVGHAGLALAVRARAPRLSLGWLMAATFGLDLLWPVLLITGLETLRLQPGATAFNVFVFDHYPWSHSLVMSVLWGGLVFAVARWRGLSRSDAGLLGALVVSHWLLDLVVHIPDLPLWPGPSPMLGLSVWNSKALTYAVEGSLYLICAAAYLRATRPLDRTGTVATWGLLVALAAAWVPSPWAPPPSATAVAWAAPFVAVFFVWGAWADRHRRIREAPSD